MPHPWRLHRLQALSTARAVQWELIESLRSTWGAKPCWLLCARTRAPRNCQRRDCSRAGSVPLHHQVGGLPMEAWDGVHVGLGDHSGPPAATLAQLQDDLPVVTCEFLSPDVFSSGPEWSCVPMAGNLNTPSNRRHPASLVRRSRATSRALCRWA